MAQNNQLNTVRIGDSYDFLFSPFDSVENDTTGLDNTLDGWSCIIYVRSEPAGTDLITPRTVAVNNSLTGFSGFLTDVETASFTEGTIFLIAEMDKSTQHVEKREKITALVSWA